MAVRLVASVSLAGRIVGLALAVPVVVAVATGWLYWLRGPSSSVPGPLVHDALPLDELPGHDQVPLLVYVAVFAVGGALLGLLARACRFERLSVSVALALGVAATLYAFDVFSLYVVRQVTLSDALHQAVPIEGTYLAAGLAGVAAGLLVPRRSPTMTWNRALAWVVAVAALGDLLAAMAPPSPRHGGLLVHVAPIGSPSVDDAILVPVSVLLLATARGLSRRRRPAYLLAVAFLWTSAVLQVLKAQAYGPATLAALIGLLLLARREDFTSPAAPRSRRRALVRLVTMLAAAVAVGSVALMINRTIADLSFDPLGAVADTVRTLVGIVPQAARSLPPDFNTWFPWAVRSVALIGGLWAAEAWLAPWRQAAGELSDDVAWARAAAVVRRWGADTLAPFALRRDKGLFFFPADGADIDTGDAAVVAYRVVRGVALVSGDPVGPPALVPGALGAFAEFAHRRGWQVAMLGASAEAATVMRSRGFRVLHHGDEAVVEVAAFSLDGGARRSVRQAVSRLERRRYTSEVVFAGDVAPALRHELLAVERAWLRGRPKRGFSMEIDDLFRLGDHDALFVVGRDPDGVVAGFLHAALCPAGRALSLSSTPRLDGTPNGFNAWLVVEAVRWCARHDFEQLSLNFSPFASLLVSEAERTLGDRVRRSVLRRAKATLSLQLDNLYRFNRQFGPRPLPRYVVYEHRTDLPLVVLAAMEIEGYLPLAERLLGGLAHRGGRHGGRPLPPRLVGGTTDGAAGAGRERAGPAPVERAANM